MDCGSCSSLLIAALLWLVPSAIGAHLVTDESIRLRALGAAFPGSSVSREPTIAPSRSVSKKPRGFVVSTTDLVGFADAFRRERLYIVTSPPSDGDERCAAEDVATREIAEARNLQFQLYSFDKFDYVLLAQYRYGVSNALACESLGRLFLIHGRGVEWKMENLVTLPTHRHSTIQKVKPLPSTNSNSLLLVESDMGGPGAVVTSLSIFEVSSHSISEILNIRGRADVALEERELFFQGIDLKRTAERGGTAFCFTKTTFAESDRWFQPPRVTTECYPRLSVRPR